MSRSWTITDESPETITHYRATKKTGVKASDGFPRDNLLFLERGRWTGDVWRLCETPESGQIGEKVWFRLFSREFVSGADAGYPGSAQTRDAWARSEVLGISAQLIESPVGPSTNYRRVICPHCLGIGEEGKDDFLEER
jgi:hypothetical protein